MTIDFSRDFVLNVGKAFLLCKKIEYKFVTGQKR